MVMNPNLKMFFQSCFYNYYIGCMGKLSNLWGKIKRLFRKSPSKPNPLTLDRVEGDEMKKYIYVLKLPLLAKGYVVTRELQFYGVGKNSMLQPYTKVVNLERDAAEYRIALPYSYTINITLTDIDVHGQRSEPSNPLIIETQEAPRPVKPGDLSFEIIEEDSLEEDVLHTHCIRFMTATGNTMECQEIHEHCQDHVHCEDEDCLEEHDHCDADCHNFHASQNCCGGSCQCN